MTAIVEQLRERNRAKTEGAEAAYLDLVRRYAREEEIDPDTVEETCAAAGRDLDDLERDGTAEQQRIADAKLLATLPAIESKERAIIQEKASLEAAFAQVLASHKQKIQQLDYDHQIVSSRAAELATVKKRLLDHPAPHLKAKLDALAARRSPLAERKRTIEENLKRMPVRHDLTRAVDKAERDVKQQSSTKNKAALSAAQQALANYDAANVEPLQRQLAAINAELANIESRISELVKESLQP